MILSQNVKSTLVKNYSLFTCSYVSNISFDYYLSKVSSFVAYISDCDGVDFSNDYDNIESLLQDFYYCSF